MINKQLVGIFQAAFDKLGLGNQEIGLKEATKSEFGDYQVNGVMAIAKELKQNPRDLAAQIVANLDQNKVIEKADVAGPGFINITLSKDFLASCLAGNYLVPDENANHLTVVIDYSSPNLAKEMHVGHLRSTIIGDALVRMYEFVGYKVIRRNHVGDWGTQFGMLLAYLNQLSQPDLDQAQELKNLEDFYRLAKQRFDADLNFAELARELVVRLQAEDPTIIAQWKKFVAISLGHCQQIYDRLNVKLTAEDAVGESFYNPLLPGIVADLVKRGIAVDDHGAKCVFFEPGEIVSKEPTPFIIQKQDGGYLYSTTDIAAIYDRANNLRADILLYVIDARQSLHMKQLFATVKKAGMVNNNIHLEHIAFGTMLGADNKPFKTRSGDTIKLTTLIDEAVARAKKIILERNPGWSADEINEAAAILGIAAIKYADLSKNRICDYLFNLDQMLAFDGNTAPYLLYAYVRINSIFKKNGLEPESYLDKRVVITESQERELVLHLIKFTNRLSFAIKENHPHYLCNYLYELAVIFMRFYENCPIIISDLGQKNSRLALVALTSFTIKNVLGLLGIGVIDKM